MTDDRRRLIRERLGRHEYAALFTAVRRRLEQAGASARSVTLIGLGETERRAVADLYGWRTLPAERVQISLPKLDSILRLSAVGASLLEVIDVLGGPIVDRRAERDAASRREEQIWAEAAAHPRLAARPVLALWLEEARARGLVRRLAHAGQVEPALLLRQAIEVVAQLPADGVPLSVVAARCTGDAHALDAGRPLTALVLRAAARLAAWPTVPGAAPSRRRLWAAVGVLCDPLSAHVLLLGLRPEGGDRLSRHLRESAEAGEPRRVTLRELAGGVRMAIPASQSVFVCENPVVVAAAADRLGPRCAPLVCVEGVPSTAALHLLRDLRVSGSRLVFHADFDWAGVRIGNSLAASLEAAPWRFSTPDYEAAVAQSSLALPLEGSPVRSLWDPALDKVMSAVGRAVFEEQVLDALLEDLAVPE